MSKEPAVIISTLTALLTALIGVGLAFGLNISDAQQDALLKAIAPLVGVIFFIGPVIRQFVYSPNTTRQLVDQANQNPPSVPPPAVPGSDLPPSAPTHDMTTHHTSIPDYPGLHSFTRKQPIGDYQRSDDLYFTQRE